MHRLQTLLHLLLLALLLAAPARAAERTLEQALLELQAAGLDLVWSDRIVRPEMRVDDAGQEGTPRARLDALLRPHGLEARPGPGGVLLVVRAPGPKPGSVRGVVRLPNAPSDDPPLDGRPLADVRVALPQLGRDTVTSAAGRFHFRAVPPGAWRLEANGGGFLKQEITLDVTPGETVDIEIELPPMPSAGESIDVTTDRLRILGDGISTLSLEQNELFALPQVAEDAARPVLRLPGAGGDELSARVHVRGSRPDEVQLRLDGIEIVEPYHLRDFGSALLILSPSALDEVRLSTGGFSVELGDRMSGVLDMTTREPGHHRQVELGLSLVDIHATASGTVRRERGHWLAAARLGIVELPLKIAEQDERPTFSDFFAKLALDLRPGNRLRAHSLRGHVLASADALDFRDGGDESVETFRTSYDNFYAWTTHEAIWSERFFSTLRFAWTRVERDRRGDTEALDGTILDEDIDLRFLRDARDLSVYALDFDANREMNSRHALKWGGQLRRLEARYDYANQRALHDPLAAVRHLPAFGETLLQEDFRGHQTALYIADQWRPSGVLSVELGLRVDRNTVVHDNTQADPRLNVAWAPRDHLRLRLAWGLFHQSQRLYELAAEDGSSQFVRSERAEHRILGAEYDLRIGRAPITLRAEFYERRLAKPRARYENLFDPISIVPELEADRVEIAPTRGLARGLELVASGGIGRRVGWLASYIYSRVEDRVDGHDMPRAIDQPHALRGDIRLRLGAHWDLSTALTIRDGRPTTAVGAHLEPGPDGSTRIVPELGPLYAERLPIYRRLDARIERAWTLRFGELTFWATVQNLTAASNARGVAISFEIVEQDGEEVVEVRRRTLTWAGIVPSFGIRWRF